MKTTTQTKTTNGAVEYVVTYHGQHGTYRVAYLSPKLAVLGMIAEIDGMPGTMVARVKKRPRETGYFNRASFPELYSDATEAHADRAAFPGACDRDDCCEYLEDLEKFEKESRKVRVVAR